MGEDFFDEIAALAVAAAILYFTVSGDYAFLKASIYTGGATGQYHATGERLAARARKRSGRLSVVATDGSVDNIARLAGENGRCIPGFAFVQDGVPVPADAGLQSLGRLPQPELLLLFARRGRAIDTFNDLKGASVGIGPDGSGTADLMRQLMENPDLRGLDLKPSNHDLEAQAAMVRDGELDLAAFVMSASAELIRRLANTYDLEIVAPADLEGLVARDRWLRLGRIPAGFYDVAKPTPATDKLVAQVDTLILTNACTHRAEREAFLMLLREEFPTFVRENPPPAAKSQDQAPLADEAREFFTNGEPGFADRYFPRLVNLMSPAYWIYLAMALTVVFNALNGYSRFRLWRIRRQPGTPGVTAQGAERSRLHAGACENAPPRRGRQDARGSKGRGGPGPGARGASPSLRGTDELARHAHGPRDVLSLSGVADRGRPGDARGAAPAAGRRQGGLKRRRIRPRWSSPRHFRF